MSLRLIKNENITNRENNGSALLSNLNPNQREAVTSIVGPLLIVAGAGSGKTRVLTHRIAYLIESGVPAYKILALTFTNKAAQEMKERISTLVNENWADKVWAGTFHSIFARILRIEANQLGYTGSFSIYDSEDSLRVIKNIMNSVGISQQDYPPQGMQSRISWAKNQMISWQSYAGSAMSSIEKQTGQIYAEYEKKLRSNNAMDFDDLLINMIQILKNSEELRIKYCRKFDYILVDEYQDTNRAQYTVLNMLATEHKNICVVGDDAQSIYKWRGADIRNILDFQKDYPKAKLIRLEQNYRSTKTILEAADSLISKNKNQISKKLWTDNEQGNLIELHGSEDDREEANKIAAKVKSLVSDNFSAKDIAVFYRTNAQSLAIENAFRRANLPYIIVGGTSFYKRKEIKDAISYLRILVNKLDSESLLRIVNEPPRGLGAVSLSHIQEYAENEGLSLFEAFGNAFDISELQTRASKSAKGFYDFINEFSAKLTAGNVGTIVGEYLQNSGLLNMYKEINTEESLDRWDNINQLITDIAQFSEEFPEAGIGEYLQQISLVSDIDNADLKSNRCSLMTLHSAKGLEFPIVFIAGLEDGLLPFSRVERNKDEEEEERRLFYVGITRARQRLYLYYANRRMRFGTYSMQSPSKFIAEIKPELIKLPSSFSGENRKSDFPSKTVTSKNPFNASSHYSQIMPEENYSQIEGERFNFKVGDIVAHTHFGKGRITGLSGIGEKRQAVVYFPSVGGKKHLMLKYANLKYVQPEN